MAFTATGASGEFHYLVEFMLDSTTLRYADEDLTIQLTPTAAAFYEGRLPESGSLVRDLGSFLEPKEVVNTYSVGIDNRDGSIGALVVANTWANRNVRIYLGEGRHKTNYSEVYRGTVAFPNGIRWNDQSVDVTVVDARLRYRKYIPPVNDRFYQTVPTSAPAGTVAYPHIEPRYKATPIPVVYGNWCSTAGSGAAVPCICIDTTTKTFKVSGNRLQSIDKYMLNAVRLNTRTQLVSFASNGVSLSATTFRLSGVAYDATTDTMSVNCRGMMTVNGTLLEYPGAVLNNLLTRYVGLSGGDLNGTAFHDFDVAATTAEYKVRRRMAGEESSETLICELLNECNADMRFTTGQYSPKFRALDLDADRLNIREDDIVLAEEEEERGDFAVEYDPDRFYVNYLKASYDFDPVDERYQNAMVVKLAKEQANVTATVQRSMNFNWLHSAGGVEDRVLRELYLYSAEPAVVDLNLTRRGVLLDLADQFDLTYSSFEDRTFQVRRIEIDLGKMTARVRGYDLFANQFAKYTADDASAWSVATDQEKADQGFWVSDDGLADPGDPNSDVSKWY